MKLNKVLILIGLMLATAWPGLAQYNGYYGNFYGGAGTSLFSAAGGLNLVSATDIGAGNIQFSGLMNGSGTIAVSTMSNVTENGTTFTGTITNQAVNLINQIIVSNASSFQSTVSLPSANVTNSITLTNSGTTPGASGNVVVTPTNYTSTPYPATLGTSAGLPFIDSTIIISPSNNIQNVHWEFATAQTTAGTVYATNTWYWPANAGTNQNAKISLMIEGSSPNATIDFQSAGLVVYTFTNSTIANGHITGTAVSFVGNSAPATGAFNGTGAGTAGWSLGYTPGSATLTHVTVYGTIHNWY